MSNTTEIDANPYELLGLSVESTEQEIRTAYRQRSLKVHPDRNPNNPDAARKFHELHQAYDVLLDPLRRLALDAKMRLKHAREARYKNYDAKRKNLVEELEERERAFKKSRLEQREEEVKEWQENEKIKEEGKRMREEAAAAISMREKQKKEEERKAQEDDDVPSLDQLDTTVRIKYTLKTHPELTTATAIASLLSPFGAIDVDSIVLSYKPPPSAPSESAPAKKKSLTALIPYQTISSAFAAVCASKRADLGLQTIEITWVGGKEPRIVDWLRKMGKLGIQQQPIKSDQCPAQEQEAQRRSQAPSPSPRSPTRASSKRSGTPFSSFPDSFPDFSAPPEPPKAFVSVPGVDFESLTLMRLRQAERDRLEREILEQEASEDQ